MAVCSSSWWFRSLPSSVLQAHYSAASLSLCAVISFPVDAVCCCRGGHACIPPAIMALRVQRSKAPIGGNDEATNDRAVDHDRELFEWPIVTRNNMVCRSIVCDCRVESFCTIWMFLVRFICFLVKILRFSCKITVSSCKMRVIQNKLDEVEGKSRSRSNFLKVQQSIDCPWQLGYHTRTRLF